MLWGIQSFQVGHRNGERLGLSADTEGLGKGFPCAFVKFQELLMVFKDAGHSGGVLEGRLCRGRRAQALGQPLLGHRAVLGPERAPGRWLRTLLFVGRALGAGWRQAALSSGLSTVQGGKTRVFFPP